MTTRRREQPLNTEPPRASRIAAKVADEIQSASLGMDESSSFYTFSRVLRMHIVRCSKGK